MRNSVPVVPDEENWDRTDYYYNVGWQVLEERFDNVAAANKDDPVTDPKYQYVWSLRYIDAAVLRDENTDADGLCDDDRMYYLQDANFNVTALITDAGAIQERYVYDPYGRVTIYNSDWSDTVDWDDSKKNEVLYCGYRYDPETRLYHVRNRAYHPTLGRWLQRDPLEYGDGMNLYEYVRSRALIYLDYSGALATNLEGKGPGNTPWAWEKGLQCISVVTSYGYVYGCVCCKGGGARAEFDVVLNFKIRMSKTAVKEKLKRLRKARATTRGATRATIEGSAGFKGALGHEQRHVRSWMKEAREWEKKKALKDPRCKYKSIKECEQEVEKKLAGFASEFELIAVFEALHINELSPKPAADYKPFGPGTKVKSSGLPVALEDAFYIPKREMMRSLDQKYLIKLKRHHGIRREDYAKHREKIRRKLTEKR